MILITAMPPSRAPGAVPTGPVARHLTKQLIRRGAAVRVLAPESESTGWPEGTQIVKGKVTAPAAAPDAFRGIEHLCLAGLVGAVPAQLRELTNLALRGGVRRVVVLSSHGSEFEDEYSDETWQWLAFEQALEKHGVAWTYLRPSGLFANTLVGGYPISGASWAKAIRDSAPIREFLPNVPYPFIDEEDVSGVIAEILLRGGYDGKTVDVSGPMISAAERSRILGTVLGEAPRLEALTTAAAARAFWREQGWPDVTIDVTFFAMSAFAANLELNRSIIAEQEATARRILGRPLRSFADWAADHAAAFAG